MKPWTRYALLVVVILTTLHFILSVTHKQYGLVTEKYYHWSEKKQPLSHNETMDTSTGDVPRRANATLLILARNSDVEGAVSSIRQMEDRFNKHYHYPYVLLNDEPFTEDFKQRISALTSSKMEFGIVPREHWVQPEWIDEVKATESRNKLVAADIIYGGSVPYRNMCRFNSGFFFRHELMQKYRWYWRIEPDVHFHCDVNYDPFLFMEDNNKLYGFTISLYEFEATIPTLWGHVKDFMALHPEYIAQNNAMGFLTEDGGDKYNLCHFWSNFEIADMNLWRGPAYSSFFEYLDNQGGFYYERWGDAPVHSIAVALFAEKERIHFFNDIGYEHNPFTHCPRGDLWQKGKCSCDQGKNFDYHGYSCLTKWNRLWRNCP